MKAKSIILILAVSAVLAGCGSISNSLADKTTQIEYFRVYDIKTSASATTLGRAASDGIGKDINDMQSVYPIDTSGEIPIKPKHMELKNPFSNSSFAALVSNAGNIGFKIATCEGAAWTSTSQRDFNGSFGHSLTLCLFPYQGGYQLDMYGVLTEKSGIFNPDRYVSDALLGSPRKFMEKAFYDTLASIHHTEPNADITFVRGEPQPGPLPWVSSTILGQ